MSSIDDIRDFRLKKLEKLKAFGMEAYPIESKRDATLGEVLSHFGKFSKRKKPLFIVGRITALRGQGALTFFDLNDGTGILQGLLKKGELSDDLKELFADVVDIGDFIEVSGTLFITKRREKTILIKSWQMLAKSLRPLPEKWHGLSNPEERMRRRYLDTLSSPESKERFFLRNKIISTIREILDNEGFIEVETPVFQPVAGGATAIPFKTHYNALDVDFYLRISDELYLKRLLVGGFSKVYEICKDFRNEGIDVTHSPEFTMIEYYQSFSSAKEQQKFAEAMLKTLVKKILKKSSLTFGENTIDFSKPFATVTYFDILKRYALISNPESLGKTETELRANQLGVPVTEGDSRAKIIDNIYKKTCRPKLIQPTIVYDYPIDMLPLTKRKGDDQNIVDAFQFIIAGIEIVKGFSELNDPIDQRVRFEEQEKKRAEGDKEAQPLDEDFIEALEYGMPPAGGVGIGIDRLVMLLTNSHNIRDVILFPTLKPNH